MAHRRRSARSRLISTVLAGTVTAGLASFVPATPVRASQYHNTNPAATVCGDGTHPIQTLRFFYVRGGNNLLIARVETRWSDFCDTVWTRVVNLTGTPGGGFASERTLTVDEKILTYSCPDTSSCLVASQTEFNDVLPNTGSSGWSHQLDVPAGSLRGVPAQKQPPAVRSHAVIDTAAASYTFDAFQEPFFTQSNNEFKNEANFRAEVARTHSCYNTNAFECTWWGQPGGASKTVKYGLDPSLANAQGTPDLIAHIRDVLLPAWSQEVPRSPILTSCNAPCGELVIVRLVPGTDPDLQGGPAATQILGNGGDPEVLQSGFIKTKDKFFDHFCGAVDDGCFPANDDDRPLISHEIGHSLGLGHCDLDYGAMCHVRSIYSNPISEGTMFWNPQTRDRMALQTIYP